MTGYGFATENMGLSKVEILKKRFSKSVNRETEICNNIRIETQHIGLGRKSVLSYSAKLTV